MDHDYVGCQRKPIVRRFYSIGDAFPDRECQSICKDSIDTILSAKLHLQELKIERAEEFILRARKRIKKQQDSSQRAITDFFVPSNRPWDWLWISWSCIPGYLLPFCHTHFTSPHLHRILLWLIAMTPNNDIFSRTNTIGCVLRHTFFSLFLAKEAMLLAPGC